MQDNASKRNMDYYLSHGTLDEGAHVEGEHFIPIIRYPGDNDVVLIEHSSSLSVLRQTSSCFAAI